jgi:hypothetical protein
MKKQNNNKINNHNALEHNAIIKALSQIKK